MPTKWTFDGTTWRDEGGSPATPDQIATINRVRSLPVSTPSEAASRVGSLAKASIAPVAAQLATQGGLSLAGLGEVGLAPLAVRALMAGATNIATDKFLPQSLGGVPGRNPLVSFGLGAGPQALGTGVTTALAKRAAGKLASTGELLAESGTKALDPEAKFVQRALLKPAGTEPFPNPLGGTELTEATNKARAPIMQTIKSARTRYGKPIGQAYQTLKGSEKLDESEAADLASFAGDLQDRLLAPAPVAQKYISQFKRMAKPSGGTENTLIELPNGEFVHQNPLKATAESLRLQGVSEKRIQQILEHHPKVPDLDDLRNMWQQIGADLAKAKGGDSYALGVMKDHLDNLLMEHLPPEMAPLRTMYRGFINRCGYNKQHQLENLANPQAVANWTFKEPASAHDLLTEARTPEQKEGVRSMFLQYVYGGLDTETMPAAKAAEAVRKKLAPYMQNKQVAENIMGASWPANMRDMVRWGKYAADFQDEFKRDPQFRKQLDTSFRQYFLARGQNPEKAMQLAMRKMMAGLSGDDQQELQRVMTTLPPPSLAAPKASPFGNRAPLYHGAALGGAILTGHPVAIPWQATMLAAWFAAKKGAAFGAASKLGMTRQLLQAFGAKGASAKGALIARMIDSLSHGGAQFGSRVLMDDDAG